VSSARGRKPQLNVRSPCIVIGLLEKDFRPGEGDGDCEECVSDDRHHLAMDWTDPFNRLPTATRACHPTDVSSCGLHRLLFLGVVVAKNIDAGLLFLPIAFLFGIFLSI
jgi:hypothetical protein